MLFRSSEILPFSHLFGIGDEIATTKAVLEEMGIFASAEVLPPLVEATPKRRSQISLGYRCAAHIKSAR